VKRYEKCGKYAKNVFFLQNNWYCK
jgi:hypothetical protein